MVPLRRQLVRHRVLTVVALMALCLLVLVGCATFGSFDHRPDDGRETSVVTKIEGLRTDPDHRGLVAAYTGGACDGPARLAVTETSSRIDVEVRIEPDPDGPVVCAAVGILRTVGARLSRPIGHRVIWSGGLRQLPFDGARLLVPAALPRRYVRGFENGGSISTTSDVPPSVDVTSSWTMSYDDPGSPSNGDRCTPTRGDVEVFLGPASAAHLGDDWVGVSAVDIGSARARLYREGSSRAPTGLAYSWTTSRGGVAVMDRQNCQGDRLLHPAELLGVARSLRPA